MEDILWSKLDEDETLLWWGKPESFENLDNTHKPSYIRNTAIVLGVCLGLLIWYLYAVHANGVEMKLAVLAILGLIALYGAMSLFLDSNKLRNKTLYALTDNRLMILCAGSTESVHYDAVETYTFDEDADGHTSLLCGPEGKKVKAHSRRGATIAGLRAEPESAKCDRFVLYALSQDDVKTVKKILSQHISQ